MKKYLAILFFVVLGTSVNAQVLVESVIDSIQIPIGEQTRLSVSVTADKGQKIDMPQFQPQKYLVPGIEIVDVLPAETQQMENNREKVTQTITLTSFDEKIYYIPPFKIKVDGKEYASKQLALKVITVPVDTLHPEKFFPPKDVQDNPFIWAEWRQVFWFSVLLLIVIAAVSYLVIRMRCNKPILVRVNLIRRKSAHQEALDEIERIKTERLTVSDDQKEYYTRLTNVLRVYIEQRFGFNAMEMTSSEIIRHLQDADETDTNELMQLFQTADLVKFAKFSTLINENDANLMSAINFIDKTKRLTEDQPAEDTKPKLTEESAKSKRSYMIFKWVAAAGMVVAAALFVYIIWQVYSILS